VTLAAVDAPAAREPRVLDRDAPLALLDEDDDEDDRHPDAD
jgi:hypothetical protein